MIETRTRHSRSRRVWRLTNALCVGLSAFAYTTTALAYCRATTCNRAGGTCATDEHGCVAQGATLYWPVGRLHLDVDSKGSLFRNISEQAFLDAVNAALSAWASATCADGKRPALHVSAALVDGVQFGYDSTGPNA